MRTSQDLLSSVLGSPAPRPSSGPSRAAAEPAEARLRRASAEYEHVTLNLPAGLKSRLRAAAAAEGTSMSAVLTALAEGWLEGRG